jgi:hypothetical protein
MLWPLLHGWMTPCSKEASSSVMTSSGSTSFLTPRPWHSGQAPKGLLKENERRLDRVRQAALARLLDLQAVDDHLDRVLLLLLELGRLGQRVDDAVHPCAAVALGLQVGEQVDVLALAAADHRREDLEAGALLELEDAVDDLRGLLAGDDPAALRAVRRAGAGVQQPEVVVDLGDRADRRAGVAGGRLLVDRDRRRQALDEVDVRLVHLPEELPGVRGEGLHVAALALREDRVEGEARLAGPGQAGEDDQGVARQVERDVLEVVLTRATHDEAVGHQVPSKRSAGRAAEGKSRRPQG